MPFIVYILYLHLLDIKIAFGQPLSVLRVVCQLLAHLHGEQGAHKYPDNGSRNRYFQNIKQGDIKSRQQPKQCDGGSRNGTCRNSLLRSNHRNAQCLSGRILVSVATSAITGSTEYATCPVPATKVNK